MSGWCLDELVYLGLLSAPKMDRDVADNVLSNFMNDLIKIVSKILVGKIEAASEGNPDAPVCPIPHEWAEKKLPRPRGHRSGLLCYGEILRTYVSRDLLPPFQHTLTERLAVPRAGENLASLPFGGTTV